MDTIQRNPARRYNCDETGITIEQHKHTKILGLKGKRQVSSLQSAERGSLVTVVTNWTLKFSITCISKEIYQTRTDEWHTIWIEPRLPSIGVHTKRDNFQWFIHSIQHTKPGRALFTHKEPGGHNLARENLANIICLPHYSSHKMQPLDKAFMGPLKAFYCQEIEQWFRSHPGRVVAVYQFGDLFGNAYKQAETGEIPANGFRATGLFTYDKNIFRPYNFPTSSEGPHAAPVNYPASANTSDQPSSSSANFSPFTSAVTLRSSYISSMPSMNLKPNPCGGTAKKTASARYKKIVKATQKNKLKQATKSKTNRLASNALLCPSHRQKRRVCRDLTPSDPPSDSDTDLAVAFADGST
jgi:hypothetical protein